MPVFKINMEIDESEELSSQINPETFSDLTNECVKDNNLESEPMFKFINGEIDFNDYLSQMEHVTVGEESTVTNESLSKDRDNSIVSETGPIDDVGGDLSDLSDVSWSSSSTDEEYVSVKESPKKKKAKRIGRSKLPIFLQGIMGQANLCYARGDTENSVKLCLEIIKEAPRASEPFKTLASIYEENGENEKSLQMRLIAAHLGPASKDEWVELAEILKKKDQYRQAVICLTRAIKLDPLNLSLFEDRADTLKKANITSTEAFGYSRLLHKLNPEKDGQTILYLCKKIAKIHYNDKKYEKAMNTLKYAFDKCPELITLAEANIYLDVLVLIRDFRECFRILTEFCKIEIQESLFGEEIRAIKCIVPDNTPTDIRAKLIVYLLNSDSLECAKIQIEILLKENPEIMGDLFWDVGLVLFEKKLFEDAIRILSPLTCTKAFNNLSLWFKLSQCFKENGRIQECLQNYRKALEYFPDDNELKLKFCKELKDARLYEEAIKITLSTENDSSVFIHERCKLYFLLEDYDNFLKSGWQLFRLHCKEITNYEDYLLFKVMLHQSKGLSNTLSAYVPSTVDSSVPLEDEWKIYLKMCQLYIERKEFDMLLLLTASMFISYKFIPQRRELKMAMIVACCMNNYHELGYSLVRDIIHSKKTNSNRVWNTLNLAAMKTDYARLHKFLIRYLQNNPKESKAVMLYANNCLIAGTYKYALNDHTILYQKFKTPMLALLVGILFTLISCQKFSSNKHALVSQALSFFHKYKELREPYAAQEVNYNLGRFFHQLELLPQAIWYYRKALECDVTLNNKMFDLKCDAAFNLHLIYMNSGQPTLANLYLQKYVVI